MSHESLRVTTAHLRELAATQGRAAAEIASATQAVPGVDSAIRTSHGVIAWSTAGAVEAIQHARRVAGDSVAGISHSLSGNLTSAADRYQATDSASGADLDQQLHPGLTAPRPPR